MKCLPLRLRNRGAGCKRVPGAVVVVSRVCHKPAKFFTGKKRIGKINAVDSDSVPLLVCTLASSDCRDDRPCKQDISRFVEMAAVVEVDLLALAREQAGKVFEPHAGAAKARSHRA